MSDEKKETPKSLYPSNSHKSKAPDNKKPEKLEALTDLGTVSQRKKSLGRRIAETFTGDDVKNVGTYIVFDIILPAAKNMLSDAVSQGAERLLFGDSYRPRQNSRYGSGGFNYNKISGGKSNQYRADIDRPGGRPISSQAQDKHDFDELIFNDRASAERVLDRLIDLINQFDTATVSDLYDLINVNASHQDRKWGWTDLREANVRRTNQGFLLLLPKTEYLD